MRIIILKCMDMFLCLVFLWRLPSSHLTPVQPRWQPPLQWPVTLSHFPGCPQVKLQFSKQLVPYTPIGHSKKKNNILFATFWITQLFLLSLIALNCHVGTLTCLAQKYDKLERNQRCNYIYLNCTWIHLFSFIQIRSYISVC